VAYFKALSQHTPGEREKNNVISRSRFESDIFRIQVTIVTAWVGSLRDVRSEASMRTEVGKFFWGHQRCQFVENYRRFRDYLCLHHQICAARTLHETGSEQGPADSLTLKMEVTCSSEMSADFNRTTRCYIPRRQNSS
jgi:hypothetical protein